MNVFSKLFFLLLCFSFPLLNAESTEQNRIYMVSLGSDPIGGGGVYVLNDEEGLFHVQYLPAEKQVFRGDGFSLHFNGGVANSWVLECVSPYQQKMSGKIEFVGAQAFPGQSPRKPGMRIVRSGGNAHNISGSFHVLEFKINEQGEIMALAVDFRQVCNGAGVLLGSIRYHSSIPINADLYSFIADENEEKGKLEIRMQGNNSYLTGEKVYTADIPDARPLLPMRDFGQNNVLHLDVEGYSLTFVAPKDQPFFSVGKYLQAARFPFQEANSPGMDISGHGRGCNRVEGDFEILEINYNDDGAITLLALDFVHYCEGRGGRPTQGTVRYNSSIPHINHLAPPPEPDEKPTENELPPSEPNDAPLDIVCEEEPIFDDELEQFEEEEDSCHTCSDDWLESTLKKLKKKLKKLK